MPKVNTNTKSMDNNYQQMLKQMLYILSLRNKLNKKKGLEIETSPLLIVKGRAPDTTKFFENKNMHNIVNSSETMY